MTPLLGKLASRRHGITRMEVVVILVLVLVFVGMVIPIIYQSVIASRRVNSVNYMRTLSGAMSRYVELNQEFPPSSTRPIRGVAPGSTDSGWSWLAVVSPQLELPSPVPFDPEASPFDEQGRPYWQHGDGTQALEDTWLFRTPGYRGPLVAQAPEYADLEPGVPVANYVAIAATTYDRLWGEGQPDGVILPGTPLAAEAIPDGSSSTIAICETREENYSAWVDGTVAAVFGLTWIDQQGNPDPAALDAAKLQGEQGLLDPVGEGIQTTIATDSDPGATYLPAFAKRDWQYGPSSPRDLVNHLFADGRIKGMDRRMDPKVYYQLISRLDGSDELAP